MAANLAMGTEVSLARGARGFLVSRIQKKLGLVADGTFGGITESAVGAQSHQSGGNPALAGPAFHQHIGLPWPSEFERCINLVSVMEGTGFGDCNRRDIDGAGVTMGIAGFTTAHGEVQLLLRQLNEQAPDEVDRAGPAVATSLRQLLANDHSRTIWDNTLYDSHGLVRREWLSAFHTWGQSGIMQRLQLDHVRRFMWEPACKTAASLGFHSLRARCLFLDIAVQNGGWKARHQSFARFDPGWQSGSETERMLIVARSVSMGAHRKWRADVLKRKQTIARGDGIVHGIRIRLQHYGIPAPEPDG